MATSENEFTHDSSKNETKERLKAAGLWQRFLLERDSLKDGGEPPKLAYARVWHELEPLVLAFEKKPPRKESPEVELPPLTDNPVDMRRDIEWVYNRVGTVDVDVKTAPSRGAYQMWAYYRRHPAALNDFYRTYVVKLLPTKMKEETEASFTDDGREQISLINRLQGKDK